LRPMSEPPSDDGRTKGGRFAPGHKFSHGMKPGTRHRATMLAEKLMAADDRQESGRGR
jgi:hypothetical protein